MMQVFDNQGNLKQKSLVTSGVNSVTATPPLFSTGGSAPDISIALATALSDGYLSSVDWSTFNNKQNALTLTTIGSSGAATLIGATLNIPQYTDQYLGTVTSVGLSAGTGISIGGTNPVTSSGTISVTNTAPDQIVALTAGTGIGVSGTYPNFTITNSAPSPAGAITGTGTTNYIPKFTSSSAIGNSGITDDGSTITFSTSATERMRLDASGNLGLGTSSPTALLDVRGTGASTDFRLSRNIDPNIYLSINAPGNTPNRSTFGINGTNVMTLNASGNVGIGTTTPNQRLTVAVAQIANTVMPVLKLTTTGAYSGAGSSDAGASVEFGQYHDTYPNWVLGQISAIRSGASWDGALLFYTNNGTAETNKTERMRLNSSGNLGLGVTPSAWGISNTSIDIGNTLSLFRGGSAQTILGFNTYINASSQFIYKISSFASYYQQISGVHSWHTAPSGTAGNAITFTQAMTLDASGRLGIGATSLFAKLQINASGAGIVDNTILENTNAAAANLGSALTFAGVGTVAQTVIRGAWDGSATTDAYMSFLTRGSNSVQERMRIASNGNVGVGIVPTAYLGFVSSAAGISLHTNSTSGAAGLNFYENGSGRFSLRTLNGTAGLSFFDSFNGAERARIDASGNLGLGVTPSAWSNFRVIQGVGTSGNSAIAFNNSGGLDLVYNTFYNGTNFIYLTTGNLANRYTIEAGTYKWYTAPSGTSGNAISFTQAMTLDASGRLGIGTATPQSILDITAATPIMTISASTNTVLHGIEWKSGTNLDAFIKQLPVTGEFRISNGRSASWGGFITFYTDISERMRLTSAGELLINTTSDAGDYKLQVNGNSYLAGSFAVDATSGVTSYRTSFIGGIYKSNSGGGSNPFISTNNMIIQGYTDGSAARDIDFVTGVTPASRLYINTSGNVGIGTTIPAFKLEVAGSTKVQYLQIENNGYAGGLPTTPEIYSPASGTLAISTAGGERMRITSGGNVGIGTTNPTNKVDVFTPNKPSVLGSNSAINVDYTTSTIGEYQTIGFSYSSSIGNRNQRWGMGFTATNYTSGTGDLFFFTDATERARITSGGNVGIGTTSPTRTLHILGSTGIGTVLKLEGAAGTTTYLQLSYNGATNAQSGYVGYDASSNMTFFTNNTERMRITSGGELLINTTTDAGDYKLQVNGAYYGNGRVYLSGTGFNVTGAPSLYLENTTATTGRTYALNSYNSGGFQVFDVTNANATVFLINSSGNAEIPTGSIKTAAPSGGTAAAWKLGSKVAATVSLVTTDYIEVEIGGVAYKLALVN